MFIVVVDVVLLVAVIVVKLTGVYISHKKIPPPAIRFFFLSEDSRLGRNPGPGGGVHGRNTVQEEYHSGRIPVGGRCSMGDNV